MLRIFICILWIFTSTSSNAREEEGRSGMIVTAHPMASECGLEILKSGGNAIDAAVGAAIVLGVVEPHASGLGGGGGMLIYLHEKDSLTFINYYARAPKLVPTDFDPNKEANSALAVLVPGTVAGLYHALTKYGTINWEDLLTWLLKKLKVGFKVEATLYKLILDSYETLLKYPQTSSIYLIDNFPPETGHTLLNNRALKTLDKLAQDGPDVFYSGEIADSIEAVMFKYGGGLRKSDLMTYQPEELKPVRGTYRGYEIFSATPPQSGITVIEILNILECQDLSKMGDYTTSPSTFHFMAEAMKRGYADRSQYLSDPNFNTVAVNILISKKYAMSRFRTINMDMAVPSKPKETSPGDLTPYLHHEDRDGSTTHISVIDASGNAVSLTQTLNRFWGSGISVCGILLNNGMTGFSAGGQINQISSNRQPRTTIAPSMLFKNGELIMVIGSPGAGRIISTIVEVICNVIDFGKGADEANIAPRFCSRKSSNTLPVEARFSPDFLEKIKSMGHPIEVLGEMDLYFGGVQLILVDQQKGVLTGSSDPRRSGSVSGY